MSEEKKVTAEELDAVAGGIGGNVKLGDTGGDAAVIDQSAKINQNIDESIHADYSKKVEEISNDDHSVSVDTNTEVTYNKKRGFF